MKKLFGDSKDPINITSLQYDIIFKELESFDQHRKEINAIFTNTINCDFIFIKT